MYENPWGATGGPSPFRQPQTAGGNMSSDRKRGGSSSSGFIWGLLFGWIVFGNGPCNEHPVAPPTINCPQPAEAPSAKQEVPPWNPSTRP